MIGQRYISKEPPSKVAEYLKEKVKVFITYRVT
jgi:hypothetical protein